MARKNNYSDKLKNPKWQKKRLEILNLHGFKCEKCGCEDKELHVHHRFYLKGREVWQYDNDVFQVLCCDCHEKEHEKGKEVNEVIPEKYRNLISLLEILNDRNPMNLHHLELLLKTILEDEIKKDETFDLVFLTEVYCRSQFSDVIKYQIRDYCIREQNEIGMQSDINELRAELKELRNRINS